MVELLSSMGVVGIVLLVVGYLAIFWLAKMIDEKSDFDDWNDND